MAYTDDVNLLGENIIILKRTAEALLEVSKGVQVLNEEKTKCRLHHVSSKYKTEL